MKGYVFKIYMNIDFDNLLKEKNFVLDVDNIPIENQELVDHIKKLAEIRKNSVPLKYGDYVQISNECLYWAFARNFNGETTVVCVNTDDNPHHFSFNYNGRQYDIDVNGRDTEIV